MSAERTFTADALRASAGVMVWAAHFAWIYGFTALACERGFAQAQWLGVSVVAWSVGAATLLAVLAIGRLLWVLRGGGPERFVDWLAAGLAGLALIGVVYEALPLAFVAAPCA